MSLSLCNKILDTITCFIKCWTLSLLATQPFQDASFTANNDSVTCSQWTCLPVHISEQVLMDCSITLPGFCFHSSQLLCCHHIPIILLQEAMKSTRKYHTCIKKPYRTITLCFIQCENVFGIQVTPQDCVYDRFCEIKFTGWIAVNLVFCSPHVTLREVSQTAIQETSQHIVEGLMSQSL